MYVLAQLHSLLGESNYFSISKVTFRSLTVDLAFHSSIILQFPWEFRDICSNCRGIPSTNISNSAEIPRKSHHPNRVQVSIMRYSKIGRQIVKCCGQIIM